MRFQGTPGSRYSRYPHEEAYERLGVRVIVADRPGYGASSRLEGRGVAVVADDTAELLDHLGLDVVHAIVQAAAGRTYSPSQPGTRIASRLPRWSSVQHRTPKRTCQD